MRHDETEGLRISEQDRRDCEALVHAFCTFIDHGEALKVVGLFTEDGVFDRKGAALRGHAALAEAMSKRPASVVTRHVCSNIVLRAESPDRIVGTTVFLFFRRDGAADSTDNSPAASLEAVGDYEDVFVRTPAGWRIASRKAVPVFAR